MKLIAVIAGAAALSVSVPVAAQVHVRGYVRKDGTYVAPHVRSSPNNSRMDNYSTDGNFNPYNGRPGTVDPWKPSIPSIPSYTPPRYDPAKLPALPCYYNCKK